MYKYLNFTMTVEITEFNHGCPYDWWDVVADTEKPSDIGVTVSSTIDFGHSSTGDLGELKHRHTVITAWMDGRKPVTENDHVGPVPNIKIELDVRDMIFPPVGSDIPRHHQLVLEVGEEAIRLARIVNVPTSSYEPSVSAA